MTHASYALGRELWLLQTQERDYAATGRNTEAADCRARAAQVARALAMLEAPGITYLAAPYSHPNPDVRRRRVLAIDKVFARLMSQGRIVFSPISHSIGVCLLGDLPADFATWSRQDLAVLSHCESLCVLQLAGWDKSVGVAAEIAHAAALGLPTWYLTEEAS